MILKDFEHFVQKNEKPFRDRKALSSTVQERVLEHSKALRKKYGDKFDEKFVAKELIEKHQLMNLVEPRKDNAGRSKTPGKQA